MHTENLTLKVLIVDDDEDDFFITSEYIKNIPGSSFEIEWCCVYEEALSHVCDRKFDIYLVDYYLGSKTGLDIINEAIKRNCEEPIILLTGKGNPRIDREAMEAGAVDYLIKGEIDTEKLERCLRYSMERSRTMKALRSNERKFRSIFERSTDAVFLADEHLVFLDANQATGELFGYTKDELLSLSLFSLMVNEKDIELVGQQLGKDGEIEDKEVEFRSKNGEVKYCILSLSKERDINSKEYLQGIIHDITNIKKAEKVTLQMEKLGMADRLVSTLAHEVRNPLSNINLSLEQLRPEIENEETAIYIDIIGRNSKRIGDLISELLSSSRPAEITQEDSILQTILDETLEIAQDRLILKHIELVKNYPLKAIRIQADSEKLKIAFLNIIINAIEAMEEGKGKLVISIEDTGTEKVVTIEDNGCGITNENLPRLFEPYFTAKRNGMGLGLASTMNILQSHKAFVEVESTVNVGTKFAITFKES